MLSTDCEKKSVKNIKTIYLSFSYITLRVLQRRLLQVDRLKAGFAIMQQK